MNFSIINQVTSLLSSIDLNKPLHKDRYSKSLTQSMKYNRLSSKQFSVMIITNSCAPSGFDYIAYAWFGKPIITLLAI